MCCAPTDFHPQFSWQISSQQLSPWAIPVAQPQPFLVTAKMGQILNIPSGNNLRSRGVFTYTVMHQAFMTPLHMTRLACGLVCKCYHGINLIEIQSHLAKCLVYCDPSSAYCSYYRKLLLLSYSVWSLYVWGWGYSSVASQR